MTDKRERAHDMAEEGLDKLVEGDKSGEEAEQFRDTD